MGCWAPNGALTAQRTTTGLLRAEYSGCRGILRPARFACVSRSSVTLAPWEYLFYAFNSFNFPDLYNQTWIASIVALVVAVVLYNVRTRQLHRHRPYLDLWEWLLWTSLITFSLLLVGAVFAFDFFLVLATAITGVATLVWVRFRRFPPILAAYERQLARQRYVSRQRISDPEATIRRRGGGRRQRRRR